MESLKARLNFAARVAVGRIAGRRRFLLRPDDIFLISYPKSGNTWTRFLAANLRYPDVSIDFGNIERLVPDLYVNNEVKLREVPSPRILKTHDAFQPEYRRVLFIVRDPRDVAVSYYHHQIKAGTIADGSPIADFLEPFMAGELDTYGSWAENVGSWLGAREGSSDFDLIRYEDLHSDPIATLARISGFMDLTSDADRLQQVYDNCRADRLMKLEDRTGKQWVAISHTDHNKKFVRKGKSGGWQDELPPEAVDKIERRWGGLMTKLGYPLVNEG